MNFFQFFLVSHYNNKSGIRRVVFYDSTLTRLLIKPKTASSVQHLQRPTLFVLAAVQLSYQPELS